MNLITTRRPVPVIWLSAITALLVVIVILLVGIIYRVDNIDTRQKVDHEINVLKNTVVDSILQARENKTRAR